MNKALEESSQKEKKKFDLIFSILTELQTRQTQLDQSLKMLKDHVSTGGFGPQLSAVSLANSGDSNAQGQQINGGMTSPMGGQVVMMGPNGMGMVGGQVGMNQFGNGMMMMDGSGNVMAPVIMAMPNNGGGQMQFINTGMMNQGVNMVPNQMMQFVVNQGEGNGDCQWNSNMMMVNGNDGGNSTAAGNSSNGSGDDTARSSGDQQSEKSQEQTTEKGKMDLLTHEEE